MVLRLWRFTADDARLNSLPQSLTVLDVFVGPGDYFRLLSSNAQYVYQAAHDHILNERCTQ